MNEERLELMKEVILSTHVSDELKNSLMRFLETYDGNNMNELDLFLDHLMVFFFNYSITELKARSFEMLGETHSEFMENIEQIKKDFDSVDKGRMPFRSKLTIEKDLPQDTD